MRRLFALTAVMAMVGAACHGGSPTAASSSGGSSPLPLPTGPLCNGFAPSPTPSGTISAAPSLPAIIAQVAQQAEQVRELAFRSPVTPEPVTATRMSELVRENVADPQGVALLKREQQPLITIGALPAGTDLPKAVSDLVGSDVIGFYDTKTHRLVFIGSTSPTPYQRMVLAHELTHALDDQYFRLTQLDDMNGRCIDDQQEAFLALAEGDAVENSLKWDDRFLSASGKQRLEQEQSAFPPLPSSIPPFVVSSFQFPYPNGLTFVQTLLAGGGEAAINAAFRNPPQSTEQIIHPDKFTFDPPTPVNVPDIGPKLGPGWTEVDNEEVGEAFLDLLLQLRLPQSQAYPAGAGWDGGRFLSWSNGPHNAVLMETVWDTANDATEFAKAMTDFTKGRFASVEPVGTKVAVLFATDKSTLTSLHNATAG